MDVILSINFQLSKVRTHYRFLTHMSHFSREREHTLFQIIACKTAMKSGPMFLQTSFPGKKSSFGMDVMLRSFLKKFLRIKDKQSGWWYIPPSCFLFLLFCVLANEVKTRCYRNVYDPCKLFYCRIFPTACKVMNFTQMSMFFFLQNICVFFFFVRGPVSNNFKWGSGGRWF